MDCVVGVEAGTEERRGEGPNKLGSLLSAPDEDDAEVVDIDPRRGLLESVADRGLGPIDPRRGRGSLLDTEPLRASTVGLPTEETEARRGLAGEVVSTDPRRGPDVLDAPEVVASVCETDNLLSPGGWTCRYSSVSPSSIVGNVSALRGNR